MSIADFLINRIKDSGVSTKTIADVAQIRPATLYDFISRRRPNLTLPNVEKLAKVLNLEMTQTHPPLLKRRHIGRPFT